LAISGENIDAIFNDILGTSLGVAKDEGYSAIDKTSFGAESTDKSNDSKRSIVQNQNRRINMKDFYKIFGIVSILFLSACNSSSNIHSIPVSERNSISVLKINYENGTPFAIVHFDKNKNFSGTFYYPDGTPSEISRGVLAEVSESGISAKHETSARFYPDGTIVPENKTKNWAQYEFGKFEFTESGMKFFADFSAKKIADEYILSIYIYPKSQKGEIAERFIIKCKNAAPGKWDVEAKSLFGAYKLEHNIKNGEKILNVKIRSSSLNKNIFDFNFDLTKFLEDIKKV